MMGLAVDDLTLLMGLACFTFLGFSLLKAGDSDLIKCLKYDLATSVTERNQSTESTDGNDVL